MIETPAHLHPYVQILGEEGAINLFLALGGSSIYLADRPQRRSALVEAIDPNGVTFAKALARHFGARHLDVPIPKVWLAHQLRFRGDSVNEIARKLHVTQMTARSYPRKQVIPRQKKAEEPKPAPRQMNLGL